MQYITKLSPSTLTVQGKLSNTQFEEVDDMLYGIHARGRINKIICNYGWISNPNYKEEEKKKKTSNRGRKKKEKKHKANKHRRGNGNCFSSQCSVYVQSDVSTTKQYKIKVFKTGTFEVPGGLEPSMRDVRSAMKPIEEELTEFFQEKVEVIEMYSLMRNYKFRLIDESKKLRLKSMYTLLRKIKSDQELYGVDERDLLSEVKYVVERYQGLIIKFRTPIPGKPQKKTTIKFFTSGKINIDGAISEESAEYYYNWVDKFFIKYDVNNTIMYTPIAIVFDDTSDEESEGEELAEP